MIRRYLILGFVVIVSIIVSFLFLNGGKEEVFYQEVQINEVTIEEQEWMERIKENGIYLYKSSCANTETCKLLLYSRKKLTYEYREASVSQTGDVMTVSLKDVFAYNDSYAKDKLLLRIETKKEPKEIVLHVNEQKSEFTGVAKAR